MTIQEANKDLKIIATPSSVYEILVDTLSKEIIDFEISNEVNKLENTSNNLNDVEVFCLSDVFTLIPSAIYQDSELANYLKYSSTKDIGRFKLFSSSIYTEKIEVAWGIEKKIENNLISKFNGAKIKGFISSVLNSINLSPKENKIYSIFLANQLFTVLVLEGKINLVNKFEVNTIEDALYYHLLLLQSSQLEGEHIGLKTGGDYNDISEFIICIEDYFDSVERYVTVENNIDKKKQGMLEMLKVLGE